MSHTVRQPSAQDEQGLLSKGATSPPVVTVVHPGWAFRMRRLLAPVVKHGLLIGASLIFLLPFYWMVVSALKTNSQIFARPMQWWPDTVHWSNLPTTLTYSQFPYFRLLWNSTYYSGVVAIGTVLSCTAVGYGLSLIHI